MYALSILLSLLGLLSLCIETTHAFTASLKITTARRGSLFGDGVVISRHDTVRVQRHVLFAKIDESQDASTLSRFNDKSIDISGKTLTLYGHQGSRSPLVNWAAYELGLQDTTMGDLSKNPHPFGKIPCLTDSVDGEEVMVFESGAILEYLQDNYGDVTSELTKSQRAAITSWIVWANASLDPVCFIETPQGKVYDTGLKYGHPSLDRLNELFKQQQYLLGDEMFSLADVAVASYLLYVPQFFPDVKLNNYPYLARYMRDCANREAYRKAFGGKVQSFLVDNLDSFLPKEGAKR